MVLSHSLQQGLEKSKVRRNLVNGGGYNLI